jgi:nucleoside-diphosphate-sugar epimerase
MSERRRILVTGATGKVGRVFVQRLLAEPTFEAFTVRALCHNRVLEAGPRLEVVRGSLEHKEVAQEAVRGATHVLHLATCKETPESVMDVAVKGIFHLLEACRESPEFKQFILIGGDNSVGHFVYPHPIPVTETQRHTAYAGCYALSKVLDEACARRGSWRRTTSSGSYRLERTSLAGRDGATWWARRGLTNM